MNMKDMKLGERAVVKSLANEVSMRRRLQDLGIIEGTSIECVGISPLGDPRAFLVKRTIIALRNDDASLIAIKEA